MSLKLVFVLSLIFTVFEHFSSSKVSSLFSAAENRQPSINVTVSGDLKVNQSRNVLLTSLKDAENAPDCSSGSWNSSSNCTEFSQVYLGINSTDINEEKKTVLPPHEDSVSVAALSNVSLYGLPVRTTTIGNHMEKKLIMSYVVAQPREIRNFPLNSTKYTNMAEIRSTRESPRLRRARSKTKSVSKTFFKEGFVATKPSTRRPKPNGKSRKKRHWPGSGTSIESPRNRRIRVTKKFPAEFESVLKRVYPDNFVTTVRNNNYYRSGNKMQPGYETDFHGFNRRNYRSLKSYYSKQPFYEPRQKEFSLYRATNENGDHTRDPFSFSNHLWPPMSRTIASDENESPYKFRVQLWPPVSSTKISDKIKNFHLTVPLNSHGSNEEEIENFYKTKSSFRFIAPHTANKSSKIESKHSEKEEHFLRFHSLTSPSQSNKAEIKYFHTIKNPFRLTISPRLSALSRAENTHSAKAKRPFQFTIPPRQIKLRNAVNENSDETEILFRFTVPSRLSKSSKARTKNPDETTSPIRFTVPSRLSKSSKARTKNSDETTSPIRFTVPSRLSKSSKARTKNSDETTSPIRFTVPSRLSKSSKASKARTKNSDETKSPTRFTIPPRLNKSTKAETENSGVTKSIFPFSVPPIANKSSKAGIENADETQPAQPSKSKVNTTPIPIQPRSKIFSKTEKSETEGMIGKIVGDTNTKLVPNVDYHYHFHHFEGFNWETLPTLIHFD